MIFSKQHMASQLRSIGDKLKQEVKMEHTAEDDEEGGALGWAENVEGDATMEEDEMEEVIEEPEPPPHPYRNVWTKQDTEAVKRGDGMVPQTVEVLSDGEGGDEGKESWGKGSGKGSSKGRYVAPWGKKTKAAPSSDWIVKVDDWGGKRYNSGWYEWRGTWYPNLLLDSG